MSTERTASELASIKEALTLIDNIYNTYRPYFATGRQEDFDLFNRALRVTGRAQTRFFRRAKPATPAEPLAAGYCWDCARAGRYDSYLITRAMDYNNASGLDCDDSEDSEREEIYYTYCDYGHAANHD